MKTTLIALLLLVATTAGAQNFGSGVTARETFPSNGNPATRPGSYVNPYQLTDQQGRNVGTMTETFPSQHPATQPGSAANPYLTHPNPGYNGQR